MNLELLISAFPAMGWYGCTQILHVSYEYLYWRVIDKCGFKMNADMSHSLYNQVYAILWMMGPGYTVRDTCTKFNQNGYIQRLSPKSL